jgi:hypothetical protein
LAIFLLFLAELLIDLSHVTSRGHRLQAQLAAFFPSLALVSDEQIGLRLSWRVAPSVSRRITQPDQRVDRL